MECKLVRDYLDGKITTIDNNSLQIHLDGCADCKEYQLQINTLEDDLNTLYKSKISRPDLNKKLISKLKAKRRNVALTIAASLVILFMTFNTEISSFAEKIPFIQDMMAYFNRDNRVEFALDKGYPIQEYITDNGEYKLLVKDIYIDTVEFKMQFTLLDENGKIPENMALTISIPGIAKNKYSYGTNPNIPWWSYSCEVVSPIQHMDSFNINFDVRKDDEIISYETVAIDISHLKSFDFEDVMMHEIIELPTAKIEIVSVNIGPAAATVKYKPIEQYNSVQHRLHLLLVDNNGKEYWSTGESSSSDSPITTVKFDYSNLENDVTGLKLNIKSYSYTNVTSIGKVKDDMLNFNHIDNEFALKLRLNSGVNKRGRLYSDEIINAKLFPELAFKETENWTTAIMLQRDSEFIPISASLIVEALGENFDVDKPETLEQLVKYVKENKGIELDLEYLKEWPHILNIKKQLHLKTTKEFFVDQEDVHWDTVLEFEGLEFGIIGEYQTKNVNIEINIKAND